MKKIIGLFLATGLIFSSCELFEDTETAGLTEDEIVKGLRTALEIGADTATSALHLKDGYLMDQAVKILLPPEAEIITSNLTKIASYIPGGRSIIEGKLDDLVVSLNRAAEDAADDALPILTSAITNLTISDGLNILNGVAPIYEKSVSETDFDSLAATHYLEYQTRDDLLIAFSAPINISLDKPFIGNSSTNDIWGSVTSLYNDAVDLYNLVPLLDDLDKVNTNLGEFATDKALTGLFIKVGEEEKKIRKNPFKWAIDILEKVFGSIME